MKIGLALAGGGAMGAAHFGVIEQIEKLDLKIEAVAGTSAGSIIGLLYVAGGSGMVRAFINLIKEKEILTQKNILLQKSPDHLLRSIEKTLYEIVGAKSFITLPKKFSVVVTDLSDGRSKVIEQGDPVEAVMASCAYPGVFSPRKIKNNIYIDGGVSQNLPYLPLREDGIDFIIGSSMASVAEINDAKLGAALSRAYVAKRALDVLQYSLEQTQIKECDYCFIHPLNGYSWYSFSKIDEIMESGQKTAASEAQYLKRKISQARKTAKMNLWQKLTQG